MPRGFPSQQRARPAVEDGSKVSLVQRRGDSGDAVDARMHDDPFACPHPPADCGR